MQGLLIKDFMYMKRQSKFYLMILVIGLVNVITTHDSVFLVGYMVMVGVISATSTIRSDAAQKGMTYLLALPYDKKEYALSKYILCAITLVVTLVLSILISVIVDTIMHNPMIDLLTMVEMAATIGVVALIITSIFIPIQIRFGEENSRLVIFAIAGIIGIIIGFLVAAFDVRVDVSWIDQHLMMCIGIVLILTILIIMASYKISVKLLDSMEY